MRTVYVDHVRFVDGEPACDMRGYLTTEHSENWLVWLWADETVRIPAARIKDVVTTEETEE